MHSRQIQPIIAAMHNHHVAFMHRAGSSWKDLYADALRQADSFNICALHENSDLDSALHRLIHIACTCITRSATYWQRVNFIRWVGCIFEDLHIDTFR